MKKILLMIVILASMDAYSLDCPPAKVVNIQVHTHSILYKLEGQNWHRLGVPGSPGVSEMYSGLLAAQMSGKQIVVRYPDGYDCNAYEITTDVQMVRTHAE